jgi:hypothetical protein
MSGLEFTDPVPMDGEKDNYPNRNIGMVVPDVLKVAYGIRKTPCEYEVFSTRNST